MPMMMMMMMAQEGDKYPLHRCIFQGDVKTLNILIRTHDITEKDKQGSLSLSRWSTVPNAFRLPLIPAYK